MHVRFPTRRADGSFDVLAHFSTTALEGVLRDWLAAWSARNSTWRRVWTGAGKTEEVLNLADEFDSLPIFEAQEENEVSIRFMARPEAKLWKDWLVKFAADFCAAHPGTELLRFESSDTVNASHKR